MRGCDREAAAAMEGREETRLARNLHSLSAVVEMSEVEPLSVVRPLSPSRCRVATGRLRWRRDWVIG